MAGTQAVEDPSSNASKTTAGLERPFTALLREDERERAADLNAVLAELRPPQVRVIRVGNPLRSPLTLERILIQVAGPEGEVFGGDDARLIVRAIAEQQGQESHVILVIEQADTLHIKVLRSLQAMSPYFTQDGIPTLQILFVGRPAFLALLAGVELTPLREDLGFEDSIAAPVPGAAMADPPAPSPAPVAPEVLTVLRTKPPRPDTREADAATEPAATSPPAMLTPASLPPAPSAPPKAPLPEAAAAPTPGELDIPQPVAHVPEEWDVPDDVEPEDDDSDLAGYAPPPVARRRGTLFLRVLVALAILFGTAFAAFFGLRALFYRDVPDRPALSSRGPASSQPSARPAPSGAAGPLAADPQPAPAPPVSPASPLPTVVTPAPPAGMPSTEQAARMRRDFDAFLAGSGRNVAALTEAQRSALFDEYLAWRSHGLATSTTPPPASGQQRIVIHVPAGSPALDALSARLVSVLEQKPGTVETRHVPDAPGRPSVRYFYPEDEAAARQTAASMTDTGLNWGVQDFSTFQPRPSRGTIEVWLPGRS